MEEEILAPGVENRGHPDLGAQMIWVTGDLQQGLGCRGEQDLEDLPLVAQRQRVEIIGQGEDDMEVGHGEQAFDALREPLRTPKSLTLWAVPVPTGVIGDLDLTAVSATQHMATQTGRSAALNGRHDLELIVTDVSGVGLSPHRTMAAEDIRDLYR